jgi:hypothetical protein
VYLNQTCFLAGMFLLPNSLSRVTGSAQVCSPYLRNTPQSRPISLEYQLLTRGPKRSLLLRPRIPNMLPLFIHNYTNRHGDSKLRKLFPQLCISPTSCVFKTSRLLLPSHLPLPPTFFLSSLLSSLLFSSLLFSSLLFSSLPFPPLLSSPLFSPTLRVLPHLFSKTFLSRFHSRYLYRHLYLYTDGWSGNYFAKPGHCEM